MYRSIRGFVKGVPMEDLKYIWYDLVKLAENFITPEEQELRRLYYCSATYKESETNEKVQRTISAQEVYIKHHENTHGDRFRTRFGYFKYSKDRSNPYEEKQTDVNLALLTLYDGFKDFYDHAFIMSGDGDFTPLVDFLGSLGKKISFIVPPSGTSSRITKLTEEKEHASMHQINGGHIKDAYFDPGPNTPEPEEFF